MNNINYLKLSFEKPSSTLKLVFFRQKCEREINEWVKQVIEDVENAGKTLLAQMENMINKVEGVGENGSKDRSNGVVSTKNISLVPNTAFEWSNLGFLAIDNVLPTDFQLNMVTLLQNVQVGSKITCVVSCQKEVSKTVLDQLHYSVYFNEKMIIVERDSTPLEFNFLLRFHGDYLVVVELYGQHVLGSPLTLPVAASALPGLLKLGLIPHDNGDEGGKSSELNISQGSECVAKWTEDMVWYRARVDKVEGEMLEVTFYDYGNKEMVARRDVVLTALDIPKGEDIDEFLVKVKDEIPISDSTKCLGFRVGDVIIAKWAEDDVWYNGEIIKINGDEGNTLEVCFTDYGNTAEVEIVDIVKTKKEIPTKDEVDENVGKTAEGNKLDEEVEVPLSRIDEAMAYLEWDIEEERRAGEAGEKTNIFSRYKDLDKSFFRYKLNEALCQIIKMDDREETKVLNLLKNFEKSPLIFSLTVENEIIFVIGEGTLFESARGNSKEREKVRRKGVSKWINKLARIFKDDGIQNLVYSLGSISNCEKEARKIVNSLDLESFTLFHPVDKDVVPPEAKDCFDRMLGEEEKVDWAGAIESSNTRRCPGPSPAVSLWPRLRRRYGSGKDKPQKAKHFQASGKYLKQFLKDLSFTCLLQNNQCAARILKYKEDQWEKDKDIIVATITESLTTWPFISFDNEGRGRWYQLGFYGESGWQVLLFDAFFPPEMMVVLEDDRSIVTGKNIHDDLAYILPNGGFGYNAVDLGVWTRDLQFHEHSNNGLKVLFQKSVGIDTEKLVYSFKKNDVETLKKYGYVRAGNWNTSEIDSRQILYMSSDVSLAGTVVFDIIIAIVLEVGVEVLDKKFASFREFIGPYVENVIDRTWDNRKQADWYEVPVTERSLLNNKAALRLSIPNFFSFEEEESENEKVLRRERFAINIVKNARKESYERRLPPYMRHPISRGDKHLAEVREVEEMWD